MSQDKKKLLVFHSIIAPYRVDFFNRLASQFQMVMHVDRGKTDDSLFSDVERECHFTYSEFASSDGLLSILRYVVKAIHDCGPETVLVSECGLVSLIVVLYKKLFRFFSEQNQKIFHFQYWYDIIGLYMIHYKKIH